MFEKEAEEYADKQIGCGDGYYEWTDVEKAFQKGAEFGYNKAKAEIKLLKETHRQSLKILTDQIEELHKANEWHYVKDGDLPKENQLVLLYRENPNGDNIALTYWYKSYVKDKVIAWKEIVLPELPKEIKEK